jgi:hypothetical protein
MNLEKRITAFEKLGKVLRNIDDLKYLNGLKNDIETNALKLNKLTGTVRNNNGWFTNGMVLRALKALGDTLMSDKLRSWVNLYYKAIESRKSPKTVAVIMAGNIPVVGFHDFLSVLISGNNILAKLSSDDDKLLPVIKDILVAIEPEFEKNIVLTSEVIKGFDAIIATGSNNSARYFEYYFGKYPGIIRKNRNGIAVITGEESDDELNGLADDIFLYYGLGCRNVSKLFVPKNYDFTRLLDIISERKEVIENNKYFNNYEYNKAIYLVNNTKHFDTGNLLLTESYDYSSPVSVVFYSFYGDNLSLKNELMVNSEKIQCIVSSAYFLNDKIPFGKSQMPELWDYADGIDTMKFLTEI